MFAVMKYDNLSKIPEGCILKRWTIGVKGESSSNNKEMQGQRDGESLSSLQIGDPEVIPNRRKKRKKPSKVFAATPKAPKKSHPVETNLSDMAPEVDGNATEDDGLRDLLEFMPNTYESGDVLKAGEEYDLDALVENPIVLNWISNDVW